MNRQTDKSLKREGGGVKSLAHHSECQWCLFVFTTQVEYKLLQVLQEMILYLEHFFLSAGPSARRSSASMLHRLLTLPSQLVEDGGEAAATRDTLVAPATEGNNAGRDVARPPSPLTARKEEEEEEEGDDGEDKGKKVRKTREMSFESYRRTSLMASGGGLCCWVLGFCSSPTEMLMFVF